MSLKKLIADYKSVNEFLGDLAAGVKDTPWPKAIAKALPWTGYLGEAAAESVAPIKFVLKLYEAATRINDVNVLAQIVCTTAFQRSVQQALTSGKRLPLRLSSVIADDAVKEIRNSSADEECDFQTLQSGDILQHSFFRSARARLQRFLELLRLEETVRNEVLAGVDREFPHNLHQLLTNGDTREKFHPVYLLLQLDRPEQRAYEALRCHAAYQRWLYEGRRILGEEPFALQHAYVRTECGVLRWGDLEQRRKDCAARKTDLPEIDPFRDHADHGGRHDVVEAVLRLLAEPEFRDLIVLQGPAGTGKSSFTLRLCTELLDRGLCPLRIELKHLDTSANRHIRDTLPEAVRLGDRIFNSTANSYTFGKELFLNDSIFAQTATLEGTEISRYVLILDAWDEISIGAEEGFQQHVERLLREVRDLYLSDRWSHPVRVILTGRPTEAVTQGRLLRDETRLLTLRYFTPGQLAEYHANLGQAVQTQPLAHPDWTPWTMPEAKALAAVRAKYQEGFEAQAKAIAEGRDRHAVQADQGLDLLGSPLLGLLSLRLLANWPDDPVRLFDSRTVLYRNLVDLLLGGGKPPGQADPRNIHVQGDELRQLLWGTAEAMTVLGREGLPKAELLARVKDAETLDARVDKLVDEAKMSRLLVSFFFHGGRAEQGCEFSHKSFREYLFAETVVEELKAIGRQLKQLPPERDLKQGYWRDFPAHDPRRAFARRLAELLAPQWLTAEVGSHLTALVEWEVQRAAKRDPYPTIRNAKQTDSLSLKQWGIVREVLADLWDWWGEGVHLRPQPRTRPEQTLAWKEPVVVNLAKRDRLWSSHNVADICPPRTTTLDSHLGDALFQLCCDFHRALALLPERPEGSTAPRRYQAVDEQGRVRFAPGFAGGIYWHTYCHRIEAAGYRQRFRGAFPDEIDLRLVDFRGANLNGAGLGGLSLDEANLEGAYLYQASLFEASLIRANLKGAYLIGADLSGANLNWGDLCKANLSRACLVNANLSGAHLSGAVLNRASLMGAYLIGADLSGAVLSGTDLRSAILDERGLELARQGGAILDGTSVEDPPEETGS